MGRRLGQHFLINDGIKAAVVEALNLAPDDTVIEIGPGHGELTQELRNKNHELRVIAIEKDEVLCRTLQQKFSDDNQIEIVCGDVREVLPELAKRRVLKAGSYKLIGNLPYYLTGRLLRIVGELSEKPSRCVFTIQKEVAKRLCAAPPHMNKLAACVQYWATPKILAYLLPESFRPAPKVESAIIILEALQKEKTGAPADDYYRTVRILFAHPRKTALNNLLAGMRKSADELRSALASAGAEGARAQSMSVSQLEQLARILCADNPSQTGKT
jgi:16S rRNA (adenine1518-N6/adenine1519-N6)-dimethyltransferase